MSHTDHATRVAIANARAAAAGRCVMHNTGTDIPARHLLELPIGNVVPLCVECCAWWRQNARATGDPESQPVSIAEIETRTETTR